MPSGPTNLLLEYIQIYSYSTISMLYIHLKFDFSNILQCVIQEERLGWWSQLQKSWAETTQRRGSDLDRLHFPEHARCYGFRWMLFLWSENVGNLHLCYGLSPDVKVTCDGACQLFTQWPADRQKRCIRKKMAWFQILIKNTSEARTPWNRKNASYHV